MQLVSVGEEETQLYIPPPLAAELPAKVQLVRDGEELELYIPPPRSWGLLPSAFPPLIIKPSSKALLRMKQGFDCAQVSGRLSRKSSSDASK